MAVKTITVTVAAYNALAANKRNGESFSKTILRICPHSANLKHFIANRDEWLNTVDPVAAEKRAKGFLQEREKARKEAYARFRRQWGDEVDDELSEGD